VPAAHNEHATPPVGLPHIGPEGDLVKQAAAALQMLAMAAAMSALCALRLPV
jgi:hypothetical protein